MPLALSEQALGMACKFAIERDYINVIFKSDCLKAISLISNSSCRYASNGNFH